MTDHSVFHFSLSHLFTFESHLNALLRLPRVQIRLLFHGENALLDFPKGQKTLTSNFLNKYESITAVDEYHTGISLGVVFFGTYIWQQHFSNYCQYPAHFECYVGSTSFRNSC